MHKWTIFNGVSLGPDACALILRGTSDDEEETMSAVVRCSRVGEQARPLVVSHSLALLAAVDLSVPYVTAITPLGEVIDIVDESFVTSDLEAGSQGPERYGYIMAARTIDRSLYVVGMSRQVYHRSADRTWVRADAGTLNTSMDPRAISGFVTVDGRSTSEIYAAGLSGEIWCCANGSWEQLDSPTNILINSLRVEGDGTISACGQRGLLIRGSRDELQVLEQDVDAGNLLQLEFFGTAGYVVTESGIFCIDPWPELGSAQRVKRSANRYSLLSAGGGALWMFGSRHAAVRSTTESWVELDLKALWRLLR